MSVKEEFIDTPFGKMRCIVGDGFPARQLMMLTPGEYVDITVVSTGKSYRITMKEPQAVVIKKMEG